MKKWVKLVPFLATACIIAAVAGQPESAKAAADAPNVIPSGVHIGDIDVSGMTLTEAETAISDYVDEIAEETVVLTANGEELETTLAELGVQGSATESVREAMNYGKTGNLLDRYKIKKDLEHDTEKLPLTLDVDRDAVISFLENNTASINNEAQDYTLQSDGMGNLVVVEGVAGNVLNIDESITAIVDYFANGWVDEPEIPLVVEVDEPKGSVEELSQVKDILATYTTSYAGSIANRCTNVYNGASKVNGTVLYPGEQFSMYKTAGPIDETNGYALAPSYENGTTVDTYGGGICQVSTTLYNAVIRAELQVDERYGHGMTVSYVQPSFDAAIAGTTQDFKFTNNTDYPIFISGWADGSNITFAIYGVETRPANREVTFESETIDTTEYTTEYVPNYEYALGTITQSQGGHNGVEARLWKIVTVDGIEESREIYNFTNYMMSPLTYDVGVSATSQDATNAMLNAIATQDQPTIWNTAAAYAAYGIPNYSEETIAKWNASQGL